MVSRTRALPIALIVALLAVSGPMRSAGAEAEDGTPVFQRVSAPYGLPNVNMAGEPTLGVDPRTGAILYQSYASTYRIVVDETTSPPLITWTEVTPRSSIVNVDPILFVDPGTGRAFAGGLQGACSVLSFTDDAGVTWSPAGNTCAGGVDHPTIGSGPWAGGPPIHALHPHAVYYCAQASVVQCALSSDGGLTFAPGVTVTCGYFNPGTSGSLHVGPNGWAYLPFRTCGGTIGVAVTKDNGLTWDASPLFNTLSPRAGFDPDVATTTSGWAYLAYPTSDWGVGVALTKDGGASWTNFGDVAASAGILSSTFHEMVAGDDGRAAVIYLGSASDGRPHQSGFAGAWHVHMTYTLDAGATWKTVRLSENVVQRGWICPDGPTCSGGRNLLDFMDAQLDPAGRIVVAYADGCLGACDVGYGPSLASHATLLRQTQGVTMLRDGRAGTPDEITATAQLVVDALETLAPSTMNSVRQG